MLNKIFYPPEAAVPDMYPETSEIRFLYEGNTYGRFKLLEGDPIAFQVTNNIILNHAMPFIADCYDDPANRPDSSRTSDDLRSDDL